MTIAALGTYACGNKTIPMLNQSNIEFQKKDTGTLGNSDIPSFGFRWDNPLIGNFFFSPSFPQMPCRELGYHRGIFQNVHIK